MLSKATVAHPNVLITVLPRAGNGLKEMSLVLIINSLQIQLLSNLLLYVANISPFYVPLLTQNT